MRFVQTNNYRKLAIPIVLFFFVVACSNNNSVSQKKDSKQIISESSAQNGNQDTKIQRLNLTVNDFAGSVIKSKDFDALNGSLVTRNEEMTLKYVLDKLKPLNDEAKIATGWGNIEQVSPPECEYIYLSIGTTINFVNNTSFLGEIYSYQEIDRKKTNFDNAKIAFLVQSLFVFSDSTTSQEIFNNVKNSVQPCMGTTYTMVLSDGSFSESPGFIWDFYTNTSGNLLLGFEKTKAGVKLTLYILHGVTMTVILINSGGDLSESDGFGFADELLQKFVDDISDIQNIDSFEVDLTKLGSFVSN
jgi:hypothetical protein